MSDLINRQDAINALGEEPEVYSGKDEYAQGLNNQWHYDVNAIKAVPSVQPGPSTEIQEILNYLDTVLHPIVSPDNWNVYAELHDMISALPSVQPETCEGCKWEDAFGYGECYRCKRRYAEDLYEKGNV